MDIPLNVVKRLLAKRELIPVDKPFLNTILYIVEADLLHISLALDHIISLVRANRNASQMLRLQSHHKHIADPRHKVRNVLKLWDGEIALEESVSPRHVGCGRPFEQIFPDRNFGRGLGPLTASRECGQLEGHRLLRTRFGEEGRRPVVGLGGVRLSRGVLEHVALADKTLDFGPLSLLEQDSDVAAVDHL